MREIKFRGQRVDTKEWIYGGLVEWIDNCTTYIDTPSPRISFIYQYNDRSCLQTLTTYIEIIPETLGQFTGLLDKNGKEIYEGDIIEYLELPDYPEWNEYNETMEFFENKFDKYVKDNNICFYEKYGRDLIKKQLVLELDNEPYFGYKQLYRHITEGCIFTNKEKTLEVIGTIHDKGSDE